MGKEGVLWDGREEAQPSLGNKEHLEGFPNIALDFIKIFNVARPFWDESKIKNELEKKNEWTGISTGSGERLFL